MFSPDNMTTSEGNVATSLKKRLSKQEMDNLIKVVCTEWISLEDIALQIGKDYNYLRKFIIPRMLKEKVIEIYTPGHPIIQDSSIRLRIKLRAIYERFYEQTRVTIYKSTINAYNL